MDYLRTIILAVVLASGLSSAAGAVVPVSPSERAQAFAQCSGRYSAMANHITEASSETYETVRDRLALFDLLLDAILPAAVAYGMPEAQASAWKFDAWRSHAAILNDANYALDERRAKSARKASEQMIAECRSLILS